MNLSHKWIVGIRPVKSSTQLSKAQACLHVNFRGTPLS